MKIESASKTGHLEVGEESLTDPEEHKTEAQATTETREVDFDFGRTPEEQQKWEQVRDRILKEQLVEGGSILGELSSWGKTVDSMFRFARQAEDNYFFFLHVEPLLDQAADLLDRGTRDRLEWDELSAKYMNLMLELGEFAGLDEIHQEEEREGLYEVEWWRSSANHAAASAEAANLRRLEQHYQWFLRESFSNAKLNEVGNAARKAGWLSGLVPYSWKGQRFDGYQSHTYGGATKEHNEHGRDAAWTQSLHSLLERARQLVANRYNTEAGRAAAAERARGANILAEWFDKKRLFQRRRTIVTRRIQDAKARSATDPDGALNYSKRLEGIKVRIHQDLRSAYARLIAADEGLRKVYGFQVPLPSVSGDGALDSLLFWARGAIEFIVRFTRLDQATVIPVSVKQALERQGRVFEEEIASGSCSFSLDESILPESAHVRLRGVSATASSGPQRKVWTVRLEPPSVARVHWLDGTEVSLDQASLAPAVLGRVREEESQRPPDVAAASAWMNASPFGDWRIKILRSIPEAAASDVRDIVLHLHVAYRIRTSR